MRFPKWVFIVAGVWGLLVVPPLYVLFDTIGRQNPPGITHPEFYYGFAGVTLAWQFAFLVIASNPIRYRPVMLPSIAEKFLYVAALVILFVQRRIPASLLAFGATDLTFGVLFVVAFLMTRARPAPGRA